MHKHNKHLLLYSFILSFAVFGIALFNTNATANAASKGLKIRYNGKTYRNKSKKLTVKYNGKKISKNSYKAILIKKKYMVSYNDIFKTGINATCKYSKKTKKLSLTANGSTLKMTVGKKTAYLNGKKVKLPVAPLSVRYVAKKKTKILVPVNYVAEALNYSYKKTGTTICLNEPLSLTVDGKTVYYTGVQGNVYYNHKQYTLSTLPVIKLSGKMYLPAEEVLKSVMGLDYSYQTSNGELEISNDDLDYYFCASVNSTKAILNNKNITLSSPIRVIRNNKTKKEVVCIPAASVMKHLNYSYSWDKGTANCQIQSKEFFDWEKNGGSPSQTSPNNSLNHFCAYYQEQNGTGAISFQLTGTDANILKTVTVKRDSNVITLSIPSSKYNLNKNLFQNFGEIIKKMEVVEKDSTVTISFTCENVADYSYIVQNKVLEINILYTYGTNDGSVTGYSLSIPKPDGITIANVSNQDLYQNKKFQIIISGNHTVFYQSHPIVINNSHVKNITTSVSGNNTVITVTTSSLMGYKIYEQGNNLEVKIAAPRNIYKNIVVLDAGHGGKDPGAQNKGTNEKDLNFKIIYTLMKSYFSGNAPDIKVYWTRTSDTYITLANRAAFAKSVGADAFISLHMNSASKSSANGTEVYYSVSNNKSGFGGITSKKMANLFRTQLLKDLHTSNRGTKTAAYYVLKHNTVPSILIELGFISGSTDYAKLTSSSFQKTAAKSIYTGITSMFQTYNTGR